MEKAKLNLMIAYAADSLFYMFLKTQVGARAPRPPARTVCRLPCVFHLPCLSPRPWPPSLSPHGAATGGAHRPLGE
jgi:hypothetical protein